MNDINAIKTRNVNVSAYRYCLPILHSWIRGLECMLHICYRLGFQKWTVKDKEDKELLETKKRIQSELKKELGLIIDVSKQGCGTSNDGNTARTFFKNYEIVSKITGIDKELVKRTYVILQIMAANRCIDVTRFCLIRKYANDTAELYISKYSWYYMPVALHKIFIHAAEIIDYFKLPIKYMSEEPQESTHKIIKRSRTEHVRHTCCEQTNEDLLHYLLASSSSDSYIISSRKTPRKTERQLHTDAFELLIDAEKEKDKKSENDDESL